METVEGHNFFKFKTPGSMGLVNNVLYRKCFWPKLDQPVRLFIEGSNGIQVQGPPTPRNVIFPDDTVFLNTLSSDGRVTDVPTRHDCFFLRAKQIQDVVEDQVFKKTVEVETGLFKEVEYTKPVMVSKEVEVITELSEGDAKK